MSKDIAIVAAKGGSPRAADLNRMRKLAAKVGYEVWKPLFDVSASELLKKIAEAGTASAPDSHLLVYFSGTGDWDGDGAAGEGRWTMNGGLLSATELSKTLWEIPTGVRVLLLFDACGCGTMIRPGPMNRSQANYPKGVRGCNPLIIQIGASWAGEWAKTNDLTGRGIFTEAVLEALGDCPSTHQELFKSIESKMKTALEARKPPETLENQAPFMDKVGPSTDPNGLKKYYESKPRLCSRSGGGS